jgi:hypothetical protein
MRGRERELAGDVLWCFRRRLEDEEDAYECILYRREKEDEEGWPAV